MAAFRILVVASDVFVRRVISDSLKADPRFSNVVVAPNAKIGMAKLSQVGADAVLMDAELPDDTAADLVGAMRALSPDLPVVLMTNSENRARSTVRRALEAGAAFTVTIPGRDGVGADSMCGALERALKRRLTTTRLRESVAAPPARPANEPPVWASRIERVELLAIGSSTGGPRALEDVICRLGGDLPVPVVLTQHMPPVFTRNLAMQLDRKSELSVREAEGGELLEPGVVYIAPGDFHMEVIRRSARFELRLQQGPPENSCRPAVDVMIRSVVHCYGGATMAVILTGMGQDGLRGCEAVREAGGVIYVQDEASSVVWGMPGFVAKAGLADKVLELDRIAAEIERRIWIGRDRPMAARMAGGKKAV